MVQTGNCLGLGRVKEELKEKGKFLQFERTNFSFELEKSSYSCVSVCREFQKWKAFYPNWLLLGLEKEALEEKVSEEV